MSEIPYPTDFEVRAIASLSGEQRLFMTDAYNRGLSANATLAALRDAGIGVRRLEGLAAYRVVSSRAARGGMINNTPRSFTPSERLYTPTLRTLPAKFRIWGNVNVANPDTGETTTYHAVINTDDFLTRGQMQDQLAEVLSLVAQSESLEIDTSTIRITTAEVAL